MHKSIWAYLYHHAAIHFRYNWGRGGQVISLPLDEGVSWHKVNVIKSGTETTLVVDRSKRTLRTNGDHKDLKAKQFGSRKDSDSLGKSAVCLQIVKKNQFNFDPSFYL